MSEGSLFYQQSDAETKPKVLVSNANLQNQGFVSRIRRGARGFILSNSTEEEILDAIRTITETGWVVPAPVAVRVYSEIAQWTVRDSESGSLKNVALTSREHQIAQLASLGSPSAPQRVICIKS
jgi:DNA-binding NarL/FixJ family response regulator